MLRDGVSGALAQTPVRTHYPTAFYYQNASSHHWGVDVSEPMTYLLPDLLICIGC